MKESAESRTTKYWARMIKRLTKLLFWLFILYLLVMGLIWAVPKIWQWALG